MAQANLQGSNINLVKQHNLQVVLLSLLYDPILSRTQLAKRTNLSHTTITNLIAELIERGIVTEKNATSEDQDELRPVGRPRTNICLEPNALFVIGIHIGVGLFRVALTNLRAEILYNQMQDFDTNSPAAEVLEQIVTSVEAVIRESGVEHDKILGVGVGASGLVDFTTGVNLLAPNLDWHDVPLREHLQNELQLPVIVDNNVRNMAIGETYFGAGHGVDSVAFVYGRTGVGAGLTFKGRVFRGSSKGAGEIGHSVILPHGGEPCRCGNSGCLETLVSKSAILKQAESIAKENPEGILTNLLKTCTNDSPIDCVFDAARQGDIQVKKMMDERAFYLGVALANLVNLFNPELILLGGIFSRGEDLFIEPTSARSKKWHLPGWEKTSSYKLPASDGKQASSGLLPWLCSIFSTNRWKNEYFVRKTELSAFYVSRNGAGIYNGQRKQGLKFPEPFRVIWKALRVWWQGWLSLLLFGLVWVLCWATLVLGPPATFGFFYAVRSWMDEKETRWDQYFRMSKKLFLISWVWFLSNLFVLFLVFANLTFYTNLAGSLRSVFQVFSVGVGFLWVAVQVYALPYIVLQEKKNLFIAWKNGLFTILASPIFSLVIWVALGILFLLHLTIMPILFGGPGLIVLLASMAVDDRIEKFGIREREF